LALPTDFLPTKKFIGKLRIQILCNYVRTKFVDKLLRDFSIDNINN